MTCHCDLTVSADDMMFTHHMSIQLHINWILTVFYNSEEWVSFRTGGLFDRIGAGTRNYLRCLEEGLQWWAKSSCRPVQLNSHRCACARVHELISASYMYRCRIPHSVFHREAVQLSEPVHLDLIWDFFLYMHARLKGPWASYLLCTRRLPSF